MRSPISDLYETVDDANGRVPMFWATGDRETGHANLGDSLAPVVVAGLSGLSSTLTATDAPGHRLVTSGTVLNWQKAGKVHVWGSGLDPSLDPDFAAASGYRRPQSLEYIVHAVRGPLTRDALLKAGVACPSLFGDPGWLLPPIVAPASEKTCELGVIPHLLDLEEQTSTSAVLEGLKCYDVGQQSGVRIISTRHEPSFEGFVRKIREITSCKRIVSKSYHGLIIPQAYGIPALSLCDCAADGFFPLDAQDLHSDNRSVPALNADRRVRDFYLGADARRIPSYGQAKAVTPNWEDVIRRIDSEVEPLKLDAEAFIDAFPLSSAKHRRWSLGGDLQSGLIF